MADLDGKSAVVTGASSGIGRATARALASDGADVAVVARREERLEELAAEIRTEHGREALAIPTDISDPDQVRAMVEHAVETFGTLDIVVNNAGRGNPGSVTETTNGDFLKTMDVNVNGTFYVTSEVLPHLRESKGNLIFTGSFFGQMPYPGGAIYSGSKWWVHGFAYSLAGTVGDDGVGVTVVNPSEVRTEIAGGGRKPMREREEEGSVTEPETVADAIAFAAGQGPLDAVYELNLYRRDKFHDAIL